MADKRYYWIKLKENFFDLETIDWLVSQKNGCEYIVLYQKLCLLTANKGGKLVSEVGEMIIPYDTQKIARDTKFSVDTVIVAMELFKKIGLVYEETDGILQIPAVSEMVGSETAGAERVRKHRQKQDEKKCLPTEAKTNAERQRAFRAKQACEGKQHIPYIEDYQNKKRYGGNYYIVMKRDCFKCKICGSVENLCVHHIDGYDELNPENNAENKMLVTCRNCHSKIHAGLPIPNDILESIDYYFSNESNELCNNNVTNNVTTDNRYKILDNRDERKDINYQQIKDLYNETCVSFPRLTALSDKRKQTIKARLNSYSFEQIKEVFKKAEASDFLKGKNNRDWQANFDWLMKDSNFAKVLDGNYDNKKQEKGNTSYDLSEFNERLERIL